MNAALELPDIFLLLTGGFGVSVWNAVSRRDGPSALAMGMAAVGTAHLAGLPAWLLVWGCTTLAIAIAMSATALLVRAIAGGDAFRIGLTGTIAMALLLIACQEHSLPSATVALGEEPLVVGSQLHQQVEALVRG